MTQLTQLFSDKAAAEDARDEAVVEFGQDQVRFFDADAIRVDDKRSNATAPKSFRRSGSPLYVVQVDFP